MSEVETKSERGKGADLRIVSSVQPAVRAIHKARMRIIPVLITLATTALAVGFGWAMWSAYMERPWTRDGTVRVYTVTMAPEVAGRIVELPVTDNKFVAKGELLMVIDPTDYQIAVELADAARKWSKRRPRWCSRSNRRCGMRIWRKKAMAPFRAPSSSAPSSGRSRRRSRPPRQT